MALKAVLFDLDGTLWHQTEPVDYDVIQAQQVECVRPLLPPLLPGLNLATLIANFWREWSPAFRALDNDPELRELDSLAFLHQFLDAMGARVSVALAHDIWCAMDVPKMGFAVYDDLLETLEQIRIRNIRTAVVTNRVDARLEEHLTSFGIAVDAVVSSAHVGYRKPHPAVFEAALRRLDVSPEEAIEVGDSYEVDVLGAKRAGMKTVLKLNEREDRLEWVADYKIRKLSELLPVLDSLANA